MVLQRLRQFAMALRDFQEALSRPVVTPEMRFQMRLQQLYSKWYERKAAHDRKMAVAMAHHRRKLNAFARKQEEELEKVNAMLEPQMQKMSSEMADKMARAIERGQSLETKEAAMYAAVEQFEAAQRALKASPPSASGSPPGNDPRPTSR